MQNFDINLEFCQFMTFNERTKKVTFRDLRFSGTGDSVTIDFKNMNYVILENIEINELNLFN